jgi:hypothetical protein
MERNKQKATNMAKFISQKIFINKLLPIKYLNYT